MIRLQYILLTTLCLLFVACQSSLPKDITDDDQQIVLHAELVAGEIPSVFISVSSDINRNSDYYYPVGTEAEVTLHFDGEEDNIRYGNEPGLYFNQTLLIQEGVNYEIHVSIPGQEVQDITAETLVPFSVEIGEIELMGKSAEPVPDTNDLLLEYDLKVELPEPENAATYFYLVPTMLDLQLLQADPQQIEYVEIGGSSIEVLDNKNAIDQYIHKNGIFIDYSKLQTNEINLRVTLQVASSQVDLLDHFELKLNTINSESMNYHEYTNREIRSDALPFNEPLINYSNVNSGLGLFTATSNSQKRVDLQ